MNIENVNRLPAITWRHLKINDTIIENLPESIEKNNFSTFSSVSGITCTDQVNTLSAIETGMGKAAEDYVTANANVVNHFQITQSTKDPVFLSYSMSNKLSAVVSSQEIVTEAGTEVSFLFDYNSCDDSSVFHAGTTKIHAKSGSLVKLIYVQTLNDISLSWENLGIQLDDDARVEVTQILLGSKRALSGIKAKLAGNKSNFKLNCVYFGTEEQNIDLNFVSDHFGCDTNTDIVVEGALAGSAVKTLRSTVDFKSGAKRSVGRESEDVLLFSPTVRNRTVPLILCAEEDVEGQHAASVGKIDHDKLFYLQSRGLSELDAKKLLLEAKFSSAVEQIPNEDIQNRVRAYLERSVDANADNF
ncbi:SufB/SufD family protein [Scatolibacter rhodanostii]|uniref:SufB/SufD family protein n=1 Tax=Scatolibacter rhodanostii TaxID=2014781 RepID=UPI000C08BE00|nr:SufD family Fe-S cluster assembly protein [Scatolibacter rhodanostii]